METIPLSSDDPATELHYAAPVPAFGSKVFAGAAILLGGLGLIVLGGCFLIGVMVTTAQMNAPSSSHRSSITLMSVLYLMAGICFAFAAIVLLAGFRGLFRLMKA